MRIQPRSILSFSNQLRTRQNLSAALGAQASLLAIKEAARRSVSLALRKSGTELRKLRGFSFCRRDARAPREGVVLFSFVFLCLIVGLLSVAANPQPSTPQGRPPQFTDIAAQAGLTSPSLYGAPLAKRYIIETNGCGVAFYDYDKDGWLDVLVLSGTRLEGNEQATNRLYRNNRNGTFTDVTAKAGLTRTGWASGLCIGDYDNDGNDDLFITYWGANVLYKNNGNGTFTDVTTKAKLDFAGTRWGSGCTFIDYDRDGKLDLFVSNYLSFDLKTAPVPGVSANCAWKGIPVNCGPKGLPYARNWLYHNNGDGTFSDVSEKSGISKVFERYPMTAVAADFNEDGWLDLYVACDSTASILYRNNGDGTFTDVALESGAAYNEDGQPQAGMGLGLGDYNNDGHLDIFKTHFADDTPILYRNVGKMIFEDVTMFAGFGAATKYVCWGAGMPDLDNDGWPDVAFVTGNVYPEVEQHFKEYPHRSPRVVFRNLGNGKFADVSQVSGPGVLAPHSSRGAAFGDFDNDGDQDWLVMNMNEPPSLLRNAYDGKNNWLKIKTVGVKSNRTGLGARVVVTVGERSQTQTVLSQSSYYSHDDLRLHFGLGDKAKADRVTIYWPSGQVDVWKDVAARQVFVAREGQGK
ncbi:MAG: CRTAC1 family protein [Acidobacteria bacterium]|nr:CRTAC1 family protein [Acidobacteriota bacterium]MBI3424042.1 CRTAC1 family protein [Acidobacteriota bacterium]